MNAVQPKILTWARETAGLSLDDAARSLGLTDARGRTGAQRLKAMELGEYEPTRPVLLKIRPDKDGGALRRYRRSQLARHRMEENLSD